MSRYIDADALIGGIKENNLGKWYVGRIDGKSEEVIPTDTVYKIIDSAPSIDLIRCAECRRVREDGGHANCNGYLYCRKWKTLVDEDGYCSWGEREGE